MAKVGKTKRRTKTKYQKLQAIKKRYCDGKVTKTDVKKVAKEYIADAVKKGNKTKAEATKSANKVLNGACSTTKAASAKAKSRKR